MAGKDHAKLLGIFFAINGGLQVLGIILVTLIYGGLGIALLIGGQGGEQSIIGAIFLGAMVVVVLFSLVLIVPQLFAALKLLKHKPGAKFWATFASIVALIGFPLGTALGIYGLWFLSSEEGKRFFDGNFRGSAMPPPPPQSWQ